MTLKLGRLTIELVDDIKVTKQPRKWNGRWTKDLSKVEFVRGPDRV